MASCKSPACVSLSVLMGGRRAVGGRTANVIKVPSDLLSYSVVQIELFGLIIYGLAPSDECPRVITSRALICALPTIHHRSVTPCIHPAVSRAYQPILLQNDGQFGPRLYRSANGESIRHAIPRPRPQSRRHAHIHRDAQASSSSLRSRLSRLPPSLVGIRASVRGTRDSPSMRERSRCDPSRRKDGGGSL